MSDDEWFLCIWPISHVWGVIVPRNLFRSFTCLRASVRWPAIIWQPGRGRTAEVWCNFQGSNSQWEESAKWANALPGRSKWLLHKHGSDKVIGSLPALLWQRFCWWEEGILAEYVIGMVIIGRQSQAVGHECMVKCKYSEYNSAAVGQWGGYRHGCPQTLSCPSPGPSHSILHPKLSWVAFSQFLQMFTRHLVTLLAMWMLQHPEETAKAKIADWLPWNESNGGNPTKIPMQLITPPLPAFVSISTVTLTFQPKWGVSSY